MCLILIAINQHARYPLVVVANRDEFHTRPATPMDFWPQAPSLLAGRDLQAGGTWLGITRQGRFAAVTNVREPGLNRSDALSRGELPLQYLAGTLTASQYLAELQARAQSYNGFNLLCGTLAQVLHYSNRVEAPTALGSGVHGISNAVLDTPWPKVTTGKAALAAVLSQPDFELDDLLPVLNQRAAAPDASLPDTGVGLAMERILSSRFINAPELAYGTRASTVLRVSNQGQVQVKEWSWNDQGALAGLRHYDFMLES